MSAEKLALAAEREQCMRQLDVKYSAYHGTKAMFEADNRFAAERVAVLDKLIGRL